MTGDFSHFKIRELIKDGGPSEWSRHVSEIRIDDTQIKKVIDYKIESNVKEAPLKRVTITFLTNSAEIIREAEE